MDHVHHNNQDCYIHAFDGIVRLVSAVYDCVNGHINIAHDALILDSIPSEVEIPFVLLHRTGFTKSPQEYNLQKLKFWTNRSVAQAYIS